MRLKAEKCSYNYYYVALIIGNALKIGLNLADIILNVFRKCFIMGLRIVFWGIGSC